MRIHLKIETSGVTIPFDHQPLLVGTIHKWLDRNDKHGNIAFYSFSQLEGGKAVPKGLKFERGASFFFSSYDTDLIKQMIAGIQTDQSMFYGLKVTEIVLQEDPDFSERELFFTASPVFIKRRVGDKIDHIEYNDSRADECLKETLLTKMKKVGINDDSLNIRFDKNYPKAGTKKITYRGVQNRANWCPVIIEARPETKLFAWNVGLGNSTGIGFGAIK